MDIKWQIGKPVIKIFAVLIILTMLMMSIKVSNEVSANPIPFDLTIGQSTVADLDWLVQNYPSGITYDQTNDQYEIEEGGSILVQGTLVIRDQKLLMDKNISVYGILLIEDSIIDSYPNEKWNGIDIYSDATCSIYRSKIKNADQAIDSDDAEFYLIESEITYSNNGLYFSNSEKVIVENCHFEGISNKNIEFNTNYVYVFPEEPNIVVSNNIIIGGQYGVHSLSSSINITGNNISSASTGIYINNYDTNNYYSFIYDNTFYQNNVDICQNNIDESRIMFNEFKKSTYGIQHISGNLDFKHNKLFDFENAISITSATIKLYNNEINSRSDGIQATSCSGTIKDNNIRINSGDGMKLTSSSLTLKNNMIDNNLYNISRYGNNQDYYSSSRYIEFFEDYSLLAPGIYVDCSTVECWNSFGTNGYDQIDICYVDINSGPDYKIRAPQQGNTGVWNYESSYDLYFGEIDDYFSTKFFGDHLCNPLEPPYGIGLQLEVDIGVYNEDFTEESHIHYSFVSYNSCIYPDLMEPEQLGIFEIPAYLEMDGYIIMIDPNTRDLYYFWDGLTSLGGVSIDTESLKDWLEEKFSWNELTAPPGQNPTFSGNWYVRPSMRIQSQVSSPNPFEFGRIAFDYLKFGKDYLKKGYFISSPIILDEDYTFDVLQIDYYYNSEDDFLSFTILDQMNEPIEGFENLVVNEVDISSLSGQEISIRVDFSSNGYSSSLFYGYKIICKAVYLNALDMDGGTITIENLDISSHYHYYYSLSNNADLTLIDSVFFTNKMHIDDSLSTIAVKWNILVNLVDENGDPKVGTTISVADRGDLNTVDLLTDSDGNTDYICLTEGIFKRTTIEYKTPHHIYIGTNNDIYTYISKKDTIQLVFGKDSDLDDIPDSYESHESVIWIKPSSITNTGRKMSSVLYPNDDNILLDEYFSLPVNTPSTGDYNVHFEMDKYLDNDVIISYEIYDGMGSTPLISDSIYLSKDMRWYSSNYFTPTSNYIRIKMVSNGIGCFLSQLRFEGCNVDSGKVSNPLEYDTDHDFLSDGLEIRDNTFWYETELFVRSDNANVVYDRYSSNSKSIQRKTTSDAIIAEIPLSLDQGNYQIYIRAGYNDYRTLDDFNGIELDPFRWNSAGQMSIEDGNLVLDNSASITTVNPISHNHIEFDYLVHKNTQKDSSFKVSVGSYSVILGNDENEYPYYEIGKYYKFHIDIDRDNN